MKHKIHIINVKINYHNISFSNKENLAIIYNSKLVSVWKDGRVINSYHL
jgi:hypothetical protein